MGLQAELQEFIRRLKVAEDDARTMGRDLIMLRQGMRDAWTEVSGVKVCVTTLTGRIISATADLPNSRLKVVGHTTSNDYGTYSVPAGDYEIEIAGIDPTDTSLDLTPIGPTSPRYDPDGGIAYTRSITRCQSNALADLRATPAAGYGYLLSSQGCEHPIGTLTWVDSRIGTGSATTAGAGGWSSACVLTNSYAAPPTCAGAVASTPIFFSLSSGGSVSALISYTPVSPPFNFCPANTACPGSPSQSTTYPYALVTAKTCPAVDLTTKFDITFAVNDQLWHNSLAETLRFYEP